MLKFIKFIRDTLVKILEYIAIVLMGSLVLVVVWQILSRYVMPLPSTWTAEVARILLIWVSLIGTCIVFMEKGHLGVDFFVDKFAKGKIRIYADILVYVIVLIFSCTIFLYGGGRLVYLIMTVTHQITPVLGMNKGIVYLAIPICGAFMVLFCCEGIFEKIMLLRGKLTKSELSGIHPTEETFTE
ncbi:MAG: TRAP transporter small permease [bacterium]|nr:TRAP transporter small permease [bacterium]